MMVEIPLRGISFLMKNAYRLKSAGTPSMTGRKYLPAHSGWT
jgi:hypothetical protein